MYILGLDTSTKTGAVVLSDDPKFIFEAEYEAKKLKGFERLAWFRETITKLLKTYPPTVVVIENYGFANAFTLVTLVEVGTVVRMALYDAKVPIVEIPPTTLKVYVTGKGVAPKEVMMRDIYKRWGFEAKTNNIADAFALAKLGLHLHGFETVTKAVAEKLANVDSIVCYNALRQTQKVVI